MATPVYDVVVVGAGLMGSAAAYYAAKEGKRVLLLEQFELLHGNGSSHGTSRIFRVAYPSDTYTELCLTSLELWRDIEKEAGVELIRMTGELDFAFERLDDLVLLEKTLKKYKVPFETLTGAQVNQRFPGFSLPDNSHAMYNPTAGVLNPTLAMATMQKLAKGLGAEISERSPVNGIVSEQQTGGDILAIITLADGTEVRGHQCIVTAGAWTNKVLKRSEADNVKLQPIATFGTYWRCKQELYAPDKFPVFIKYGYPEIYGLPMMNPEEGVKICRHDGPNVNPDARQGVVQPAAEKEHLQNFVAENFSQVDSSAPNQVDDCMYTMTEDANFLIDFLPIPSSEGPTFAVKEVVVGAGFSGHGAKMTPVIGQMLADLALKGVTRQHPKGFHLSRKVSPLENHSFPKL
ncbi:Sarcosine oxidase [Phytophthora cinnamomi]|uniref:Sarcosine oxidase n=1 Tax=Phytophthora cinnamomi TaxID=4785 RepID=UPI00355A0F70|nr:Sarcosine oxidase [Phytophthora cinnamomi]